MKSSITHAGVTNIVVTQAQEKFTVLLIGASGTFGGRLATLLVREPNITVLLAGRQLRPLEQLAGQLDNARPFALDRASLTVDTLRSLAVDLIIDASGPFQAMQTNVIEAAIACHVHYIDLSDGRQWVRNIIAFDDVARAAGSVVITGASSTPALSHAVIDELTADWLAVDSLSVVISPSGAQAYGLAVVRALLGTIGQPVRVFHDGHWTNRSGWGLTRRICIPRVGRRFASLAETPDLDLMVERYRPRQCALFLASLELPLVHLGVSALAWLVRMNLLSSLEPMSGPLRHAALLVRGLSNQMGGMLVTASGLDATGSATHARWSLSAHGDAGPHVPVLAALILTRRLALRLAKHSAAAGATPLRAGASSCAGLVRLDEFADDFSGLKIRTESEQRVQTESTFRIALGDAFDRLPAVTKRLHQPKTAHNLFGEARVHGAENIAGRAIAKLFGLPRACDNAALQVSIRQSPGGAETWTRVFGGDSMVSRIAQPDARNSTVVEQFGPLHCTLALHPRPIGLDMTLASARLLRFNLPRWLAPKVSATERTDGERHLFAVSVTLPIIGRLVAYDGWLRMT